MSSSTRAHRKRFLEILAFITIYVDPSDGLRKHTSTKNLHAQRMVDLGVVVGISLRPPMPEGQRGRQTGRLYVYDRSSATATRATSSQALFVWP
jgi:hypothetical protein